MSIIKIILVLLLSIGLSACKETTANNNDSTRAEIVRTELYFGKEGIDAFKKHTSDIDTNYMQQVGMGFVHLDWKADDLGNVRVHTEGSSLDIPYVRSAMGTIFNRKTYQGIHKIKVHSLLNKDEYATEQEAYRNYVKLIEELKAKGWKQISL